VTGVRPSGTILIYDSSAYYGDFNLIIPAKIFSGRLLKFFNGFPKNMNMSSLHYLRKISALAAVTLIVPVMAFAGSDKNKADKPDKPDKGEKGDKGPSRVSPVPEANTAWILIPFLGLVLVFSARQFFPKKATE
jgi:hypothetical protein